VHGLAGVREDRTLVHGIGGHAVILTEASARSESSHLAQADPARGLCNVEGLEDAARTA
jgi:hypothetical protein